MICLFATGRYLAVRRTGDGFCYDDDDRVCAVVCGVCVLVVVVDADEFGLVGAKFACSLLVTSLNGLICCARLMVR